MQTILVVDDEKNLRRLYESELSKEGYQIITASNGTEAVNIVKEKLPDLVVLDIRMPGMDGIEALGKILSEENGLPVIINTAYPSYQDNFMSWAADAYVIKSADMTTLKSKIKELLEKKEKDN